MSTTTVDAAAEREPDAATAAEKRAVTLNYEAMLAALNDLLAEIREERRQAEASSDVVMPSMARNRRPPTPQRMGRSARRTLPDITQG